MSEKKGGELRKLRKLRELRKLRKLGEKRELIIFGHKAQEIPPKISFTRETGRWGGGGWILLKELFVWAIIQIWCSTTKQRCPKIMIDVF
ncbi:MAG: hypothetical protein F6J86_26205 [Symploca sp. SIO1B1]|nr:hypothetical protein [Symploca sp. SIO1B1]